MTRPARLRASGEVRETLSRGRRVHGEDLVAHVVRRADDEPTRVAVLASRKVGNAVRRNRARRLLRVAGEGLPPVGLDVVLVARASTPARRSHELRAQVEHLFDQVRA